jgi:hypothetical protein
MIGARNIKYIQTLYKDFYVVYLRLDLLWRWYETLRLHRTYLIQSNYVSYPCNRPWSTIGLWDVEGPTLSNKRLTDGGKVVSITRRPPFTPQEDSWYSFLLRGRVDSRAIVRLEGLGQLKKIHLIGTRTRDIPACQILYRWKLYIEMAHWIM